MQFSQNLSFLLHVQFPIHNVLFDGGQGDINWIGDSGLTRNFQQRLKSQQLEVGTIGEQVENVG